MSNNLELVVRGDVYAEDMKVSLRSLAIATKKDVATLIKEQAPTMARYLAQWTMPQGDGEAPQNRGLGMPSKIVGEKAVASDIARVYVSSAKILASLKERHDHNSGDSISRMFSRAVRKKDAAAAQLILRQDSKHAALDVILFDDGNRHESARRNGRVSKSKKPVVVLETTKLNAYRKKKMDKVGWTKAAWINAGFQISGKAGRAGKWVTRHTAAPATGVFISSGSTSESKLTAGVPWVSMKIDDRLAMEGFDRNIRKAIAIQLEKLAEKERNKK